MATKKVLNKKKSLLDFWENPDNHDLIVNAKPLQIPVTVLDCIKEDSKPRFSEDSSPADAGVSTVVPASVPTVVPASVPAGVPTGVPASVPTSVPAGVPASVPTSVPAGVPASVPASVPTSVPTSVLAGVPTSVLASGESGDSSDEDSEGVVKVDELTMFPACCVGKLFWLDEDLNIVHFCSAFYIGGKKIMTVAHVFYDSFGCPIDGGIFVPAMINKYDIYGRHFGYFEVTSHKTCTGYRHYKPVEEDWTPWFDMATAQFKAVKQLKDCSKYPSNEEGLGKLKSLRKNSPTEYYEQFMTTKIDPKLTENCIVCEYPKTEYPGTVVYGYADSIPSSDPSNPPFNPRGKMTKVQAPEILVWDRSCVRVRFINATIPFGMSGGPWMQNKCFNIQPFVVAFSCVAAGMQCGTNFDDNRSFSPDFFEQRNCIADLTR